MDVPTSCRSSFPFRAEPKVETELPRLQMDPSFLEKCRHAFMEVEESGTVDWDQAKRVLTGTGSGQGTSPMSVDRLTG